MHKNIDFLRRNSLVYNYILRNKLLRNLSQDPDETTLRKISDLAYFAWFNHCGFFIDGRIENLLLHMGEKINFSAASNSGLRTPICYSHKPMRPKRNLIIATRVAKAGGHTRVISDLIRRNGCDSQTLLLTQQGETAIPDEIARHNETGKVKLVVLRSHIPLLQRALYMRQMSEDFDRVLLFTHPNDVIPILAFAVNSSQPVIVENHAHFSFWLGTSIADVVICHFPRMVQAAFQRRRVNNPFFFPMVIIDERAERYSHLTKQEAKKMIGLDESSICILTVGTREKFLPNHGYNFFSTAKKITQRYPNAWILIIGLSPDDALVQRQLGKHPPRIRMLGVTDTPFLHYKAADIFMESFPLSSLGAVQDSIHYGDACPLYAYGTNRGLLSSHAVYNKDMFGTIIPEIYTEEKYLQYLGELIADLPLRRKIVNHAKANLARIWSQHGTYRRTLFELADSLQHTPHAIRHGIVEVQSDDVNVAGLSRHKTLKEVSTYFRRSSLEFSPRDNLTLALLLIRKGVFVKEALISIVACLVNAATAFLCSK